MQQAQPSILENLILENLILTNSSRNHSRAHSGWSPRKPNRRVFLLCLEGTTRVNAVKITQHPQSELFKEAPPLGSDRFSRSYRLVLHHILGFAVKVQAIAI